jgi:hypothetical protein
VSRVQVGGARRRKAAHAVIPAKAGIQTVAAQESVLLDYRLRGNDKEA